MRRVWRCNDVGHKKRKRPSVPGDKLLGRAYVPRMRECITCGFKPIPKYEDCPNCGRNAIGEESTVWTDSMTPRGRQYDRDL